MPCEIDEAESVLIKAKNAIDELKDVLETHKQEQWMLDVNNNYQGTVKILLGVVSLIYIAPFLAVNEFVVPDQGSGLIVSLWNSHLAIFALMFGTLVFWTAAFAVGVFYVWYSSRWIKYAWGRRDICNGNADDVCFKKLESRLDWSFWLHVVFFVVGMGMFLWMLIISV